MTRTFSTLAICLTLAILATIGVGFWSFFLPVSEIKKDVFMLHFYLGLGRGQRHNRKDQRLT